MNMIGIRSGNRVFGLIMFVVLIAFSTGFTNGITSENENLELPSPITFISGNLIPNESDLLESFYFELSDINPTQTYLIPEAYDDLIFLFKNVSGSVNFYSRTYDGDNHGGGGFNGTSFMVRIKLDSVYEFELSRGFIDFDSSNRENAKVQTEIVDISSGVLEIYQVTN